MNEMTLFPLLATAATVGIIHTLVGLDHYIPFIAMSKAGRWSASKTLTITVLCGIGHVLGSIALGALGIAFGWAIEPLKSIEGTRGSIAGWLLIGFGLAYFVWAMRRRWTKKQQWHNPLPSEDEPHKENRDEGSAQLAPRASHSLTPWILFTIFVFGPCEPLIPLLMFPAAQHSFFGIAAVALVFSLCTIVTMTTLVMLAHRGLSWVNQPWMERNSHVLAGLAICVCGLAVQFGL